MTGGSTQRRGRSVISKAVSLLDAFGPEEPELSLVEPARLRRTLTEARRTGLACAREEMSPGSQSVASPVTGPGGEVVAALGLVVRTGKGDVRRLGPAVRTAALSISRSLDGRTR